MTTTERAARNAEVVRDRARGMTLPTIAGKYGITERQCRRILNEFRESEPSLFDTDPVATVEDMLRAHDAAIDELAELADRTPNDSVRLGAVKTRLQAVHSKFALMQAVGVLPRDLGGVAVRYEAAEIGRLVFEVLDRNDVPDPVLDEILAVVESGSSVAPAASASANDAAWPDAMAAR